MRHQALQPQHDSGGQVLYLVYRALQRLANGRQEARTCVRRIYLPKDATDVTIGRPGTLERRTGRKVYGVKVMYRSIQASARGKVATARSKIVQLSDGASDLKLTDPRGPLEAVG